MSRVACTGRFVESILTGCVHYILTGRMQKKKSWFNFARMGRSSDALGTAVADEGASRIGGSRAAASNSERAPLFSGSRSDAEAPSKGGLLASLVKNK
jgi:hypothetical protein